MNLKGKKGIIQLNQITPILVTILIAAFIIGITVISASEIRDQSSSSGSVINGTLDGPGSTANTSMGAIQISSSGITVANKSVGGPDTTHTIDSRANGGECTLYTSPVNVWRCGNFTLWIDHGTMSINDSFMQSDVMIFNYTHAQFPIGYVAVNNTIGSVFNLSGQLPLFGTIVGLFIILGIIFLLVGKKISIGA